MRQFFTILLLLAFNSDLFANGQGDSTEIKGVYRLTKGFVVDLCLNRWADAPAAFDLKTFRSRGLNIYYYYNIALGGDKFSFNPGIGLGLDNYSFSHTNLNLYGQDSLSYFQDSNPALQYKKSKINATYLDIPLELQFKSSTNLRKAFRMAIGVKAGVLLGAKSKIKYEEKDVTFKEKRSMEHFMNPIRYGLIGRIGIGRFNFFGYYGLSELFRDHRGPAGIQSWSIGITLSTL